MKYFAQIIDETFRVLRSEEISPEQVIEALAEPVNTEVRTEPQMPKKNKKTPKPKKEKPEAVLHPLKKYVCSICSKPGHTARTHRQATSDDSFSLDNKTFGEADSVTPVSKSVDESLALTKEQYLKVRDEIHNPAFNAEKYASVRGISVPEVKWAVKSMHYQDYLDGR